jgi:hypothetical protein
MSKQRTVTRNTGYRGRDRNRNNNKIGVNSNDIGIYNTLRFNARRFPLPESFRTTLVYYEQINYTAVTTPQLYIFRGNGPYDPNQTGTGLQPVGYDNLSTFYSIYGCIGSRITIKAFNLSTVVVQLALAATQESTTVSSYDQLAYFGAGVKFLSLDGTTRGGSSFGELAHQGASTKVKGKPWNADFLATVSSVPGTQFYWSIAIQTADQATAISLGLQITVEYDVVYSSPKFVTLS